jgi:hypothetical protein
MSKTYRLGHWVTADFETISNYVRRMHSAVEITHPSLLALQDLIETDPEVYMLFTTMFTQKVAVHPGEKYPGNPISNYMDMLRKMQIIIPGLLSITVPLVLYPSIASSNMRRQHPRELWLLSTIKSTNVSKIFSTIGRSSSTIQIHEQF